MGTSILLAPFIPILAIIVLFQSFTTIMAGPQKTEIELPYDPDNGIVWTYDDMNDPYIELAETKIEGDKQIFAFTHENRGTNIFESIVDYLTQSFQGEYSAEIMDIVFTDKNGKECKYYAESSLPLDAPDIYPAEECLTTTYTCVAKVPVDNASWRSTNALVEQHTYNPTETFTVVAFSDDVEAGYVNVSFSYDYQGVQESYSVTFKVIDGELTVSQEQHELVGGLTTVFKNIYENFVKLISDISTNRVK